MPKRTIRDVNLSENPGSCFNSPPWPMWWSTTPFGTAHRAHASLIISTGGGAFLELLEKGSLPGMDALTEA